MSNRFSTPLAVTFAMVIALLAANPALAASVTVTWAGTVSFATGDLDGPIAANDTVTGSLTYESTSAGVFTPSPNPMFVRAEMLYANAITAVEFSVNGDTVTGTAGFVEIFDSLDGMFGGDDSWEATGALSSGSIGGVTPDDIFFNPSFAFDAWTLASGDPVLAPLDQAQATFPQFLLGTPGGGSAYGTITSYTVSGAGGGPSVPALGAWGITTLAGALLIGALRRLPSNSGA